MMLQIKDLKVSFGKAEILRGINLGLEIGDSISIVGESGAGKTTLGLSIMGLVKGSHSGEVRFRGKDLLTIPEEDLRGLRGKEIAMVFQNVEDALDPVQRAQDQVAEAIRIHQRIGAKGAEAAAKKILMSVGLKGDKARAYPHQLSGGERQRVIIAMALANDPALLILDEPTASLDALTKADILRLFRSVIVGRISLVITHDIALASALTEQMAVLYAGEIVEMGRTDEMLREPRHPYTRGLIRSYPGMTTTKDLQSIPGRMVHGLRGCPFHERCTQRIEICQREMPPLREIGGRQVACHRGGIVPLLDVRDLCKSFDSCDVLRDINLTLYEGETLALVGESGSGKSTLSKLIMGLYEPDSGDVVLEQQKVLKRDISFYSRVQMIFQNPKESVSHRMNVLDAVLEPLVVQKKGTREERLIRAKEVLDHVELPSDDEFLQRYPHQLSGGEVQRVAIARALALGPKLLIADEPTSALDPSVQAKILKLLMGLQDKMGLAMLFVTHDISLARKVSDRMAVMHKGRIVETGATNEVLSNPEHPYTRKLVQCASGEPEKMDDRKMPDREISKATENIEINLGEGIRCRESNF
ncbi:MAG: putative ABC transporter ATP-binding protein [Methanosaeta sp. PtaU1.Bin060]|nr:MAG: putative ABC transporter ATP-binding protein [Methanosaeta sp. PtaU1.Bin060]